MKEGVEVVLGGLRSCTSETVPAGGVGCTRDAPTEERRGGRGRAEVGHAGARAGVRRSAVAPEAGGLGYTRDDLKKARAGDHFRLVFGKARSVEVMNKPVEVTELVVASGAIWVRSGDKIRRFAKYQFKHQQAFEAWLRDAAKVQ